MIIIKKCFLFFAYIISFLLITGCFSSESSTITGRYLKVKNNSMIIDEYGCPIVMSNDSKKEDLFKDLENGDRININCSAVLESYPGQCSVYKIKFIEKGTIDDIPKETLDTLKEMG